METKHTQGPWEADDLVENNPQHGKGGEQVFKVVGPRPYGGLIADVSCWWYDRETAKANARLIAAAPKMLADLEWIAQEIRWGHDMTASLAVAEQSIAKAKGE